MCRYMYVSLTLLLWMSIPGCGDDATEADRLGVGAQCTDAAECESADENVTLECLTQFTGGYCGLEGCATDSDCPEGSACVTHDDGDNYCFRICGDKVDCNRNRSENNWSNCSANVDFVDGKLDRKACVPPSSGL